MYSKDEIFYSNHIEFISPTAGYVAGYYEDGTNAILKWNGDLTPVNAHGVTAGTISGDYTQLATDYIRFDIADDTGGPYHLKLTDAAGRVVVNTTTTNQELNISHLPSGMYFLKVEEGERIAMTQSYKTIATFNIILIRSTMPIIRVIFCLLLLLPVASAQHPFYKFDSFDKAAGLSKSTRCIDQDEDGFFWLGTDGDGLYRFDGVRHSKSTTR